MTTSWGVELCSVVEMYQLLSKKPSASTFK